MQLGRLAMKERVKIFTYAIGEGSTFSESDLEEQINQWLKDTRGTLRHVSQSECQRAGASQHVSVCLWYEPEGSGNRD
jgi:hypothetical protein